MRNETKVINYNEMKTLFLGVDKTKETNLKYEVEVGMNKGKTQTGEKIPNPYLGTTKVVSGNFKLSDYTKRVIVNGGKEGIDMTEWETEKPKGKTPISFCLYVNDNDTNINYLGFEPVQNFSKPKVEYYFEGNTIEKHLFEQWMKKESENTKQPQEKEVMWRTLNLRNIREFTLDSTRYIVQD
jgi:hypothetical protein